MSLHRFNITKPKDGLEVSVWGSRSINYHKAIVAYLHNKKEVTIW